MAFIVHCMSAGTSGLGARAVSKPTFEAAEKLRDTWYNMGAHRVEIRPVDDTRDWNDRSDPVVRDEERYEREDEYR